ncbi:hypothetical protein [Tunturiibacter lichenicola]|uniref:hypothetical protein n=1 Tax=Tunturiibacter lichenicola TaxID=2051959 RepID=UPI0021B49F38|nr:hypothetical protein [Edaphobacter lichenicola]
MSDKTLEKGVVPVAAQFHIGLRGVLRNPGAGFGAGFGAGLYRNLVRFGAIFCNTP